MRCQLHPITIEEYDYACKNRDWMDNVNLAPSGHNSSGMDLNDTIDLSLDKVDMELGSVEEITNDAIATKVAEIKAEIVSMEKRVMAAHKEEILVYQDRHGSELTKLAVRFALATGLRLGEQALLRWQQVYEAERILHIVDAKHGPRDVPVSPVAQQVLLEIKQLIGMGPYVFTSRTGSRCWNWYRSLQAICVRNDITDLRWHDLRRTAGSRMLEAGYSIEEVSKFLGHKDITTTQKHYAFLSVKKLADKMHGGTVVKETREHADSKVVVFVTK